MAKRFQLATAVAALAAMTATSPALAGICNLTVQGATYDRSAGKVTIAAPSREFAPGDGFVMCFQADEAGYVSAWDRIPRNGPIERLVPNENYSGEGVKAAKVSAGENYCFGDGKDGYLLFMDPADGTGRGLVWLVFTPSEADQPADGSFETAKKFQEGFQRLGAGSFGIDDDPLAEGVVTRETECEGKPALSYLYKVSLPQ
ncbi:MAG: hypothetical protein KTR21_16820 [Rhodobacteraceae bacterium]|nr:hypothetical protein [Paracoccaceae bacterium]